MSVHGKGRRSWIAEVDDLDRLAAAQPDADVEHIRTAPGAFRMRLAIADFGLLRMQLAEVSNSYLVRGKVNDARHAMLFLAGETASSRLNGMAIGAGDAVALRAGSEVRSHVPPGQRWMAVAFDPAAFDRALAPLRLDATGRVVCRGLAQAAPRLRGMLSELAGLVATAPERLEGAAVAEAVVDEARLVLEAGLEGCVQVPSGRVDARRLRLVRDAADYLDSVLDRPVYSAAVGEALGTDARAVNGAFRAVYGMTLHRYLLIRRLDLARRRLMCGGAGAARVKTVALDLGFWHLGRFALDYRALFGETPSATLARGRAAAGEPPPEHPGA
jgi:AraC family ethanolamine operon transcriptional activator